MNKVLKYFALAAGFFVTFILISFLFNKSINWGTTGICTIVFVAIEIIFDQFSSKKK